MKDAEAAAELDPGYARAYLRRGSAHQALDHFEEAVKDFEKVGCCHDNWHGGCRGDAAKTMHFS